MDDNHLEKLDDPNPNSEQLTGSVSTPVVQSQLCSSCRFERAAVICSVCNEIPVVDNFVSLDVNTPKTDDSNSSNLNLNEIYFQKSVSLSSKKEDEENKSENKGVNLDVLMRKGNMVYCQECFDDIHKAMANHIPVDIFQLKVNLDDTNNQSTLELDEQLEPEAPITASDIPEEHLEVTQQNFLEATEQNHPEITQNNVTEDTEQNEQEVTEQNNPEETENPVQNDPEDIEQSEQEVTEQNHLEVHDHVCPIESTIANNFPDDLDEENIIASILHELVSISSSNLEQEEKQQLSDNNIMIQGKVEELFKDLNNLNIRCEQFNDVKQSIRTMNDLIRDDLFMDFGVISTMIRLKLDEVSNRIKLKLKDAYSVVRDKQVEISNKISEIKVLTDRIKMLQELRNFNSNHSIHDLPFSNFSNDQLKMTDEVILQEIECAQQHIIQINEELKRITEFTGNETKSISIGDCSALNASTNSEQNNSQASSSLFIDNSLYPKFNYFVDTRKLVEAIQEIEVQIGSTDILNPKTYFLGNDNDSTHNLERLQYSNNSSFYCSVTSGIMDEGNFWLQLNFNDTDLNNNNNNNVDSSLSRASNVKINMFIEEMSKYIRKKRIGDKSWQTFSEAKRKPETNEKCFVLEPKTRKWLRARVVSYENGNCKLRFLDTGYNHVESNQFNLGELLIWHDFDLANYPARTIKCVLQKPESQEQQSPISEYVKNICLETKFYFKDTLANRNFKCELIEPVEVPGWETLTSDELTWIVKLHKIGASSEESSSINQMIDTYNNHELLVLENKAIDKNKFRSIDFRVQSGMVGIANSLIRTNCTEAPSEPPTKLSTSSSFTVHNNNPNPNVTDSESTSKGVSDVHYIASSVANSFSDKVVEEVFRPELVKTTAESLPVVAMSASAEMHVLSFKIDHCEENLDVKDQKDNNRYFQDRDGICRVDENISSSGIFWIRPLVGNTIFKNISRLIGDQMAKTHAKSFAELQITPEKDKKCFFLFQTKNGNGKEWNRGFIEDVQEYVCQIRNLDRGNRIKTHLNHVYPHSHSEIQQPKYLAIRCSISRESVQVNDIQFKKILVQRTLKDTEFAKSFNMIEQVIIDNQICWFTILKATEHANTTINDAILNYKMPQSKSSDVIGTLRIRDEEVPNEFAQAISLQNQNFGQIQVENMRQQIFNDVMDNVRSAFNGGVMHGHGGAGEEGVYKSLAHPLMQNFLDHAVNLSSMPPSVHRGYTQVQTESKTKNKKKKNNRNNKYNRETKDDTHLDNIHPHPHDNHSRRRSRSTDSKEHHLSKIDQTHPSIFNNQTNPNNNTHNPELPQTQSQDRPVILNIPEPTSKLFTSDSDAAPNSMNYARQQAANRRNNNRGDKRNSHPAASSCKTDGVPKGCGRRHDHDDQGGHGNGGRSWSSRPGNNMNSNSDGRDGGREATGGQRQGYGQGDQTNTGKKQALGCDNNEEEAYDDCGYTSVHQAVILNTFPNNHTDCRFIAQSEPQSVPYVVNWATNDDQELNSSAFNDVFIEDNYNCRTDNDYDDSKYGDDSDEQIISENINTESPEFYEYPIFSSDSRHNLTISPSTSEHTKIRVTSLKEDANSSEELAAGTSKLTKSRCVYSIVHADRLPEEELTTDVADGNRGCFIPEKCRGSSKNEDLNSKDLCRNFLSKWNPDYLRNDNDFDLLGQLGADDDFGELEISGVLHNENDVTTLDLTGTIAQFY
jgi:hypothetical protein